jgi:hypothetical protein
MESELDFRTHLHNGDPLIQERLNETEFPDQSFASLARQIISEANERKRYVARTYRALLKLHPDFRRQLDTAEPGWSKW